MSATKSPQVIQLSAWHKSSSQLGRFGWRIGTGVRGQENNFRNHQRRLERFVVRGRSLGRSSSRPV
jgi:hypothetical protein